MTLVQLKRDHLTYHLLNCNKKSIASGLIVQTGIQNLSEMERQIGELFDLDSDTKVPLFIGISPSLTIIKSLHIDLLVSESYPDWIIWEMSQTLLGDAQPYLTEAYLATTDSGKRESVWITWSVKKKLIEQLQEIFSRLELNFQGWVITPKALFNSFLHNYRLDPELVGLLNVEKNSSSLALVENGRLIRVFNFPNPESLWQPSATGESGFAVDIYYNDFCTFLKNKVPYPLKKLILSSTLTNFSELAEKFMLSGEFQVEKASPFAQILVAEDLKKKLKNATWEYMPAVGLCLEDSVC